MRSFKFLTSLGVVALIALACSIPAGYYCGKYLEEGVEIGGPQLLVIGWAAFIFEPAVGLAWVANPLLLIALIKLWRNRFASTARWAAVATAFSLFPLAVLLYGWNPVIRWSPDLALAGVLESSYGPYAGAELRLGYFLWVAAHLCLMVAASTLWWLRRGDPTVRSADPVPSPMGRSDLWPDEA
jgi:hypothetical protein